MSKDVWGGQLDNLFHGEEWDQNIKYNQKERAKMMIKALDDEPELMHEFNLLLRQKKLNQLKNDR